MERDANRSREREKQRCKSIDRSRERDLLDWSGRRGLKKIDRVACLLRFASPAKKNLGFLDGSRERRPGDQEVEVVEWWWSLDVRRLESPPLSNSVFERGKK